MSGMKLKKLRRGLRANQSRGRYSSDAGSLTSENSIALGCNFNTLK